MTIEVTRFDDGDISNESTRERPSPEDAGGRKNDNPAKFSQAWFDELDRLEMEAGGVLAVPKALADRFNKHTPHIYEAAKSALHNVFLRTNGADALGTWGAPYDAYSASVETNLLEGVPFAELRKAFDDGKGQELQGDVTHPPKMAAIYSSSALVVNTFGPWYRDPSHLAVNGHHGFNTMTFEAQVPHGLRGTPPHLDLRLDGKNRILAIESKCLEYLRPKKAVFAQAYDTIADHRAQSPWFRHIAVLRENSERYRYLDAAQLIKHYLGLSHSASTMSLTLLYLFWEPCNWQEFEAFRQHRAEIREFSDVVAGDRVRFESLSYGELWREWEGMQTPAWLAAHVQRLLARYRVEL